MGLYMTHFRKRLDKETMMEINEMICRQEKEQAEDKKSQDPQDVGETPVSGGVQGGKAPEKIGNPN